MQTDTLANCVYALRAETGNSLSSSQGQNAVDTLKYLLKRTQLELWTGYQWPTLKIRGDTPMSAGQWIYDYPTNLAFEQVREVWAVNTPSGRFTPVAYGIGEDLIAVDGSNKQSGDTPLGWAPEGDKYRVYPTPISSTGSLRFVGMKPLSPFIADSDVSTLDSTAIVLFAAAEQLARAKAEDASVKLKKAQVYLISLLGNSISAKMKVSTLGAFATRRQPTPGLDYVPMSN